MMNIRMMFNALNSDNFSGIHKTHSDFLKAVERLKNISGCAVGLQVNPRWFKVITCSLPVEENIEYIYKLLAPYAISRREGEVTYVQQPMFPEKDERFTHTPGLSQRHRVTKKKKVGSLQKEKEKKAVVPNVLEAKRAVVDPALPVAGNTTAEEIIKKYLSQYKFTELHPTHLSRTADRKIESPNAFGNYRKSVVKSKERVSHLSSKAPGAIDKISKKRVDKSEILLEKVVSAYADLNKPGKSGEDKRGGKVRETTGPVHVKDFMKKAVSSRNAPGVNGKQSLNNDKSEILLEKVVSAYADLNKPGKSGEDKRGGKVRKTTWPMHVKDFPKTAVSSRNAPGVNGKQSLNNDKSEILLDKVVSAYADLNKPGKSREDKHGGKVRENIGLDREGRGLTHNTASSRNIHSVGGKQVLNKNGSKTLLEQVVTRAANRMQIETKNNNALFLEKLTSFYFNRKEKKHSDFTIVNSAENRFDPARPTCRYLTNTYPEENKTIRIGNENQKNMITINVHMNNPDNMDDFAEKINSILISQARRYGIDI